MQHCSVSFFQNFFLFEIRKQQLGFDHCHELDIFTKVIRLALSSVNVVMYCFNPVLPVSLYLQ